MNCQLAALVLTTSLLASCATSEEIRLRMRVAELEQIVAGKDDDLGYLMAAITKQEIYVRQLERGMVIQAEMMAKARGNCDL